MIRRFILFCILNVSLSTLTLYAQNITHIDSVKTLNDVLELDEVQVTATKQPSMTGMLSGNLTLNPESLDNLPSISGNIDLLKILELTPSVRTSGDGNSNLYVRGGDAGQNLIIYNGAPCYSPGHALGFFPLYNAYHISSLTLNKNGEGMRYGDFLSSVIHVKSKSDIPSHYGLNGSIGLLASDASVAIPISKNWGAYASGRVSYLNLILDPLINRISKDSTQVTYNLWDSNLTLVGEINSRNKLQVDIAIGQDKLNIDDEGIAIQGYLKWSNWVSTVNFTSQLTERLSMNQVLFYSYFQNQLYSEQGQMNINLTSQINNWGYNNSIVYKNGKQKIEGGISYSNPQVKPHELNIVNVDLPINPLHEEKQIAHSFTAFALVTQPLTPRLTVFGGLKQTSYLTNLKESTTKKNFSGTDVQLGAQYRLSDYAYLRGNYTHNNQFTTKLTPSSIGLPTDFWVLSNAYIRPQFSNNYTLGFYVTLGQGGYEFSSEIYYRKMGGLTEFDYNFTENDNVTFLEKINFGNGDAYGIELMFKKNRGDLTGWISYAWGKTNRWFDDINEGKSFPARFDRRHDFSAFLNYKLNKKWNFSLNQIIATGNTYTQPTSWYFINNMPVREYTKHNNARLPNYIRTDFSVKYSISKKQHLSLACYNVFAKENPIYIFMTFRDTDSNKQKRFSLDKKPKRLYSIIPSISWTFNI